MAEAHVRGVIINYEVVGNLGPWIALTPARRDRWRAAIELIS